MFVGKDHSVGILLSILIHYFDLQAQLLSQTKPRGKKRNSVYYVYTYFIFQWIKRRFNIN